MEKTGKSVLIFISAVAIVFVAGLLFMFSQFWDNIFPNSDIILKAKNELIQKQAELKEKGIALAYKRNQRKQFANESENYWIVKRDGELEGALQKNIENAARNVNVTINSIGNLNLAKLNEQFSYSDLNLEILGAAEDISRLLVEIYKSKPKLYWVRCMIRQYRANDSTQLVLSGTLRLVCIDDNSVVNKILEAGQ